MPLAHVRLYLFYPGIGCRLWVCLRDSLWASSSGHSGGWVGKGRIASNYVSEFEFHFQFPCGSLSTLLSHFHQSAQSKNEHNTLLQLFLKPPLTTQIFTPFSLGWIVFFGFWHKSFQFHPHKSFPLVIILLILITFPLNCVMILFRENWCWSLLGLKGLTTGFH